VIWLPNVPHLNTQTCTTHTQGRCFIEYNLVSLTHMFVKKVGSVCFFSSDPLVLEQ